jgi:hypothetical protein
MPRFTARTALMALLVWLAVAFIYHLRSELFSGSDDSGPPSSPLDIDPNPEYEPQGDETIDKDAVPFGGKHFSDGGNEPLLEGLSAAAAKKGKGSAGNTRRTAVVVASQKSENSTWLEEYFPEWERSIYKVDVEPRTEEATGVLTVPKNKGRESMVYLTYVSAFDPEDRHLRVHEGRSGSLIDWEFLGF